MTRTGTTMEPQIKYAVDRLKMTREILGLTIEGLGLVGPKSFWSNFENLRAEPRLSTIIRYCDGVGVPLDVLLKGCPDTAGGQTVWPEEIIAKAAKLYGKESTAEVPEGHLWLLVCLGELSDRWKGVCKAWLDSKLEKAKREQEEERQGREEALSRILSRHGFIAPTFWCVDAGDDMHTFTDAEVAKLFAAEGGYTVQKITKPTIWLLTRVPEHTKNIVTHRGTYSKDEVVKVVGEVVAKLDDVLKKMQEAKKH